MHVPKKVRAYLTAEIDNRRPETHIGNERRIHYIEMQSVRPGRRRAADLVGKMPEIGRQQ
jgi:hypothetical protein